MPKDSVRTSRAPAAIGPYSQAIVAGGQVFCSGQVGLDPESGQIPETVEEQTRQALMNLKAVLRAAGCSLDDVVRAGVFLTDMADFPRMNAVYEQFFRSPAPARSTVAVSGLPLGVKVEVDAIALVPART
ncbi:MAG: RidA family protein [Planctomycetota bacterium]|jgi:2-iminobutanoate/2-iminopropanoate deaminase